MWISKKELQRIDERLERLEKQTVMSRGDFPNTEGTSTIFAARFGDDVSVPINRLVERICHKLNIRYRLGRAGEIEG